MAFNIVEHHLKLIGDLHVSIAESIYYYLAMECKKQDVLRIGELFGVDWKYYKEWGSSFEWAIATVIIQCSLINREEERVLNEVLEIHLDVWRKNDVCR